MKLITKITLCIILSIFALALLFIIVFSFSDMKDVSPQNRNLLIIPDDKGTVEKECGQFKKVVFEADQTDEEWYFSKVYTTVKDEHGVKYSHETFNRLTLVADEHEAGVLTVPAAINDFITTEVIDETLYVRLKTAEMIKSLGNPKMQIVRVSGFDLTLKLQNLHIVNNLSGVQTIVQGIVTDTIDVCSKSEVALYNCTADIFVRSEVNNLKVNRCSLGVLNVDLDKTHSWTVEDSKIGIENLTGSGKHSVHQSKSECQTVNWFPKSRKASLQVQLYGDTAQIKY